MSKTKIAITLDEDFITEIDHLVKEHKFINRSQAIQEAVREKLQNILKSQFQLLKMASFFVQYLVVL